MPRVINGEAWYTLDEATGAGMLTPTRLTRRRRAGRIRSRGRGAQRVYRKADVDREAGIVAGDADAALVREAVGE